MSGYREALLWAGAGLFAYKEFPDGPDEVDAVHGCWWAFVEFHREYGFAHGTYGPDAETDEFQQEFPSWQQPIHRCGEHRFTHFLGCLDCPECGEAMAVYKERMAEFGARYLKRLYSLYGATNHAVKEHGSREMVDFIEGVWNIHCGGPLI